MPDDQLDRTDDGYDVAHSLTGQLRTAAAIGAAAGDLALRFFHSDVTWSEKSSATDLVSEADQAVESLITSRLREAFPDDAVVGEEGTDGTVDRAEAGQRRWYVDPIDGTTNFLKGLPLWGVSMGLADGADELLLGVIVLPVTGEVLTAARGQGAQRNGVPITISAADRLDRTLISYALPPATAQHWGPGLAGALLALAGEALGTRMQGCSVADLAAVATGRIDATIAGGMSPWDVAAGLLLCAEAGATITAPDGRPVTGPAPAFLASPPAVHDAMRDVLAANGALPDVAGG